jgi:hypothetical protein
MKEQKKYSMVQLDSDLHRALKNYCKYHGFQIKGFIQSLVRQALRDKNK